VAVLSWNEDQFCHGMKINGAFSVLDFGCGSKIENPRKGDVKE